MAAFKLSEARSILAGYIFSNLLRQDKIAYCPGSKAHNVLHVSGIVVDGEVVVVGSDTYIVDMIDTDLTENTVGALTTADPVQVTASGAHGLAAGDLIRIESEFLKVLRVISTTSVVCARGRCGSAVATHVDDSDIYTSDAAHATSVPIGTIAGDVTAATFTDALVQEINNPATTGGERATAKTSTSYGSIVATGPQDAEVHIKGLLVGVLALTTTETFTNGAWLAATMFGGSAAGEKRIANLPARVPTDTEVTLGEMWFYLDFTPTKAVVWVETTATGARIAWVGEIHYAAGSVMLDNSGGVDFANTDTVYVVAFE